MFYFKHMYTVILFQDPEVKFFSSTVDYLVGHVQWIIYVLLYILPFGDYILLVRVVIENHAICVPHKTKNDKDINP